MTNHPNRKPDIYLQHDAAFKSVSAYVVTDKEGHLVARIAFKFAASGLCTTCYMHWLGEPMVRGRASGGGYDKASAAAHKAAGKLNLRPDHLFKSAIKDEGRHWDDDLRAAGFNVLQAV